MVSKSHVAHTNIGTYTHNAPRTVKGAKVLKHRSRSAFGSDLHRVLDVITLFLFSEHRHRHRHRRRHRHSRQRQVQLT